MEIVIYKSFITEKKEEQKSGQGVAKIVLERKRAADSTNTNPKEPRLS